MTEGSWVTPPWYDDYDPYEDHDPYDSGEFRPPLGRRKVTVNVKEEYL